MADANADEGTKELSEADVTSTAIDTTVTPQEIVKTAESETVEEEKEGMTELAVSDLIADKEETQTKGEEESGPHRELEIIDEHQQDTVEQSSDVQLTTTTSGEETGTAKDKEQQHSESKSGSRSSSRAEVGLERKISSRKKEKRKKKKSSVPKLRRRSSSKLGTIAEEYVQSIIFPYLASQDHLNTGLLNIDVILQILCLPELNLQLTEEDLPLIQSLIDYNEQGLVDYGTVAINAHKIISFVYSQKPDSQSNWVELQGIDGTKIIYNKKTGEVIDHAEDGMDLFEATIKDLFESTDIENKGFISREGFIQMLKNKTDLQQEHIHELAEKLPDKDEIDYSDFHSIGKELVLKVYQIRDQSESEWMHLNSPSVGGFYLNKITGETKRTIAEPNVQDAAFFEDAYTQINDLTFQLEQERVKNKELENQIAQFNEHLEEVVAQLDETGRQLDNTNIELQSKDEAISQLNLIVAEKDRKIEELNTKEAETSVIERELQTVQQHLIEAYQNIQEREVKLGAQEQTIQDLSQTIDDITEELKNAHGIIDARDSNINTLQYNLTNEESKVKELKRKMPSLETKLSTIVNELNVTKKTLEDKTGQLHHVRKQLKQSRERHADVEKKMEGLEQVKEKLQISENENRTLKSFLTSKTAMIERRKKEIHELREKMSELEARDNRRAIILADVLEKTARSYQQQLLSSGGTPLNTHDDLRPFSAPNVPLEELITYHRDPLSVSYNSSMKPTVHNGHGRTNSEPFTAVIENKSTKKKSYIKTQYTTTKLPPIHSNKRDFAFTTQKEMKQNYKKYDANITRHNPLKEDCTCEVCTLKNRRGKEPAYLSSLTGKTPLEQIKAETDMKERELSKQIKIGQRVLVQIKKSIYDLEPQKLTGVVKYIGKVDSEYVDNRIYVGVKLDEASGNTDGIYKGKKYFDCPPGHGRMVRITSIIAAMPYKGIVYKPLQMIQEKQSSTLQTVP